MKHEITLRVNNDTYSLAIDPWRTLNEVLQEQNSDVVPEIAVPAR